MSTINHVLIAGKLSYQSDTFTIMYSSDSNSQDNDEIIYILVNLIVLIISYLSFCWVAQKQ